MQQPQASFLFDLDGTLVDSVYQHVLAWNEALDAEGIKLSAWRIHRKIGMSGGLLTNMLLRETGLEIDSDRIERLQRLHAQAYIRQSAKIQPLPGAHDGLRPEEWACAPHSRRKIYLASLLVIDAGTPRCVVQRAARSLRVSTRGTARGAFVRSSKSATVVPRSLTEATNFNPERVPCLGFFFVARRPPWVLTKEEGMSDDRTKADKARPHPWPETTADRAAHIAAASATAKPIALRSIAATRPRRGRAIELDPLAPPASIAMC
jgi:beta-phosphoglucomutase-like phosphatase (HAD superfamily)